eukprot:m.1123366 g.1123366  ORF g.1123366 m.1123366 type:complete len:55 (+) comp24405_c0_seq1:35-199(+)
MAPPPMDFFEGQRQYAESVLTNLLTPLLFYILFYHALVVVAMNAVSIRCRTADI